MRRPLRPVAKPVTIDTATVEQLRHEVRRLQDRLADHVDERFLGWWLIAHAETLTIHTTYGATIDTTGGNAVQSIRAHLEQLTKENAWRAA